MRGRKYGVALFLGGALLASVGTARAVVIAVGSASGAPGAVVSIDVTVSSEGATVLATQNRIDFTRQAFVRAGDGGTPDCAVNPAIDKNATGFRFLPLGCDPAVDCESVRVFVLAIDNLTPIADGARLYTCAVQIALTAPAGSFPLTVAEVGASSAGGMALPTTGVDGLVTSVPAAVAQVVIGSAEGEPGDRVPVAVTLSLIDQSAEVAAVQADLAFDPATPVAATLAGRPDCTVGAELGGGLEAFAFLPLGCTPDTDCTGVRALAVSPDGVTPLADDAVLYTCAVAIAADASPGVYPLLAGDVAGSDPNGMPAPLVSADGAVTVDAPPACAGDCDRSGDVSIDELLIGVNILIGGTPLAQCPGMDSDHDGGVAINELVRAVNAALGGCPA